MKKNKKWLALTAMSLGVFMSLLDVTVVNVALPTMATELNTTFTNLQWVLNAYTLMFAVTLLIVSKLGDMYGRKKIFMISMVIFIAASAVNGMASSLMVLDISRGVQAVGGAGMNSLSMALTASNFEGRSRGTALGILGSVIGLSTASGPLVGGYLVGQFGWSSIFFVNVPIGLIALVMSAVYIQETPSYGAKQRIDFLGMLLSAATLFTGIFGLIQKENHSHWAWTDMRIAGWLMAAILLLIIFIVVELKVKDPMMNLTMFKQRHFVGATLVALTLGLGIYAFNAFLTGLMQNYIGYSALQTGVRQLTISMWSLILGPITGILGNRFSKKWMISGSLLIGGIGFLLLAHAMGPDVSFVDLWPGMVLMGIMNGMVNPLLNTAGMEGVKLHEMGMASGLLNVFRQIGTTVGVVVLGLIQTSHYEAYLNGHLDQAGLPTAAVKHVHSALITAGPFSGHQVVFAKAFANFPGIKQVQQIVVTAYDKGMTATILASAGIAIAGAVLAALLMRSHAVTED